MLVELAGIIYLQLSRPDLYYSILRSIILIILITTFQWLKLAV